MMQAYRTEGNYRSAARLSPAELRAAMANREILQATALAFDTQRQLRFEIGGVRAVMPFAQCADGAANGTVRDIAVLTRVGRTVPLSAPSAHWPKGITAFTPPRSNRSWRWVSKARAVLCKISRLAMAARNSAGLSRSAER